MMRPVFIFISLFLIVSAVDWKAPFITVDLKIGSTEQALTLQVIPDYDDILVIGEKCTSFPCKERSSTRNAYIASKSKSANDTKIALKTKFGRSTLNGNYINDVVTLDGLTKVPIDVGVLSIGNVDFFNVNADGVFGLSLKNYYRSANELKSVVKSLLEKSDKKWVTVWINKATTNEKRIGHVTFGNLNAKYCLEKQPQFYPNSFSYQFNVEKLRFGPIESHRVIDSRVDFQEQYIRVPTIEYKQILKKLDLSSGERFSCSKVKDIKLELKINGVFYSLSSADYTFTLDNTYCNLLLKDNGDYYQDGNGYVLGEPFLRSTCVTFDIQQTAIGFSSAKASS